MKHFIADSACCGRRPKAVGSSRIDARPRLIKKMMSDRGVARFIVAPNGFGKTSLACEYAESMFDFENVYWVNAQSPCFLRDLDDGDIASSLLACAPSHALAVFDDVPYLDDERADAFSRDIDALLARQWEVVVATCPAVDSLAERQNDRVLVSTCDLMVDDAELPPDRAAQPVCRRVPVLVWGDETAASSLLDDAAVADVPAEVRYALFVMAVLDEGDLEDVSAFVRGLRKDSRRFIDEHYPYVGFDAVEERFATCGFSIADIEHAFRRVLEPLVRSAGSSSAETAVARLASLLCSRGRHARACELMASLCPRTRRAAWIEAEQDAFLAQGRIDDVQRLFDGLGERAGGLTPSLLVGAGIRLYLLGDDARALRFCLRALGHPDCDEETACRAALCARAASDRDVPIRAAAVLRSASDRALGPFGSLSAAAAFACGKRCDESDLDAMESCCDDAAQSSMFLYLAAQLLRSPDECFDDAVCARERLQTIVRRCLACRRAGDMPVDAAEASARDAAGPAALDDASRARRAESLLVSFAEQRASWGRPSARTRPSGGPRAREKPIASSDGVALMEVRLFGGMEVRIGGDVLDSAAFRKQKAKTLLAVLVLHRGKEVARGEMFDILWPDAPADRAANNFYSLWSALRHAFADGEGACPYVARRQAGYMVDARYMRSDVEEFERIWRMLSFERPDVQAWLDAFARLQDDFACDLLPSETANAYIERLRERYKTRLGDLYVRAAERLCDAGEAQAALLFAQAAEEQCDRREDAYCALMRAQMLAGKRSLAMETFVACRDFMRDELGMDPSERMASLHRALLTGAQDGSPMAI